jgi:hypothetical protein
VINYLSFGVQVFGVLGFLPKVRRPREARKRETSVAIDREYGKISDQYET